MDQYYLLGKKGKEYFSLPKTWSVLNNVVLKSHKPEETVYDMCMSALLKPIGTSALSEKVKKGNRVVIIVDDMTRPTPKATILGCLVEHLQELGVEYNQIDILFGVGTHRPLIEEEIKEALGNDLYGKLRCTMHDSRSEDLVKVGTHEDFGDLKVNPLLTAADFRIAVGSVLPHPMAGFGGGAKVLMPGVSNFKFIRNHHNNLFLPRTYLGETSNPFMEGIRKAARMAHLDFIVNSVFNSNNEVMAMVAGDMEEAHEAGAAICLEQCAAPIDPRADISIVSSFPYYEGAQLMKPLVPGAMITKTGGTMILYSETIQGGKLPEPLLSAFDKVWPKVKHSRAELAIECLENDRLIVEDGPLDFNAAVYLNLLLTNMVKVVLVSPDTDAEQATRLGFDYSPTMEGAIEGLVNEVPKATVNILSSGAIVVPIVKEPLVYC